VFIFWVVYVVLSLGLIAALISKIQEKAEHTATEKEKELHEVEEVCLAAYLYTRSMFTNNPY
jgi:hypothetical protein